MLSRVLTLCTLILGLLGTTVMLGCDDKASADVAAVTIGNKKFFLELAIDNAKRFRGLSERTHIDPDGGMLFVFPAQQVQVHGFVMRDCPIGIDIIYLDPSGRIVAMAEMTPEPPRNPAAGEGTPADAENQNYNSRLKQYSSRFPAQFVIELAAGSLKKLNLKEGDQITFDKDGLIKRTR